MKAKVNNFDVLTSGVLISNGSETVELFPFDDDPNFIVRMKTAFRPEVKQEVKLVQVHEGDLKVALLEFNIERFYVGYVVGTSEPLSFAVSDDNNLDYFISVTIRGIGGDIQKHTVVTEYTIVSKERR